jgi:hypothetical protein
MRSCCRRGNHLESKSRTRMTLSSVQLCRQIQALVRLETSRLPKDSLKISSGSMANFSPEP